ncbi:MAG: hypothetical protein MO846_07430 [Candidatus Devosia symbiotica]|nr:hypothetical protein [Candidatus Devosia symbiotica]
MADAARRVADHRNLVFRYDPSKACRAYIEIVGLVLSSTVGMFFWQSMAWPDVALVVTMMATTCLGHG